MRNRRCTFAIFDLCRVFFFFLVLGAEDGGDVVIGEITYRERTTSVCVIFKDKAAKLSLNTCIL